MADNVVNARLCFCIEIVCTVLNGPSATLRERDAGGKRKKEEKKEERGNRDTIISLQIYANYKAIASLKEMLLG